MSFARWSLTGVGFRHDVELQWRIVLRFEDEVEDVGRLALARVHVDHFGVYTRLNLVSLDVNDHGGEKQQ